MAQLGGVGSRERRQSLSSKPEPLYSTRGADPFSQVAEGVLGSPVEKNNDVCLKLLSLINAREPQT